MSALTTDYIVNNGNYDNKDLSEIFAPIGTAPQANYDVGTYTAQYSSAFNTNVYRGFALTSGTNLNAFESDTTNVVTTGWDNPDGVAQSYLQFSSAGVYRLELSIKLDNGTSGSSGYTATGFMRLNNTNSTANTSIPGFNTTNIISYSFSGNSSAEASENNVSGATKDDTQNLIQFYRTSGNAGYPVFKPLFVGQSSGAGYVQLYTLSVTFNLTQSSYKLYPQLTVNFGGTPWTFSGNWMVTKLG